jgi:hypothetical protein
LDVKRDVTQRVGLESSLDDVGKVMQRYESNTQIDTATPEKKVVVVEKIEINEKSVQFEREKEKEIQPAVELAVEPSPAPPVETPIGEPDYQPPTYIQRPPDSYSPNNLDNIFNNLFEQEGRGKTGIGDSRQVVAGGPREQQEAIE